MIRCIYDSDTLSLSLEGHSGLCESGKDIVCAGVSVIAFSLAGYFGGYEKTERGMLVRAPVNSLENRAVFEALTEGLRMIERDFPENLLITRGRLIK